MDIADRVKGVMAQVMMIDKTRLDPAALLVDDLQATSLDRIELIMALEDEFKIEIPEGEESIKTVGDIIAYVEARAKT